MLERCAYPGGVVLYVSPLLRRCGVVHGFTARHGGVSPAPFDALNLGIASCGPEPAGGSSGPSDSVQNIQRNYGLVQEALGCAERSLAWVNQVHGAVVHVIGQGKSGHDRALVAKNKGNDAVEKKPAADALVTDRTDVLLSIRVADCVPILLAGMYQDGQRCRLEAGINAGWRAEVYGVVGGTVEVLRERWGIGPGRLIAAVGPCIGPERFEVGEEVARAFRGRELGLAVREQAGSKPHIDLAAAVAEQLCRVGVADEAIDRTDVCTFVDRGDFFSHRRDAGRTGRMAALIGMAGRGTGNAPPDSSG